MIVIIGVQLSFAGGYCKVAMVSLCLVVIPFEYVNSFSNLYCRNQFPFSLFIIGRRGLVKGLCGLLRVLLCLVLV